MVNFCEYYYNQDNQEMKRSPKSKMKNILKN